MTSCQRGHDDSSLAKLWATEITRINEQLGRAKPGTTEHKNLIVTLGIASDKYMMASRQNG